MCAAPGASAGASTRQCGVDSRHGAENSALKNIAPFKRTPFRTCENASIGIRLPADVRQTFLASAQSILAAADSRSRIRTSRAFPRRETSRTIARVYWRLLLTSERAACVVLSLLVVTGSAARPAFAQPSLSLSEAIRRARTYNPDVGTALATEREAAERVAQARGGYFPRVDVAESWQRGNYPVFVFGTLLAQGRFTAADFALDALNHPAATNNFRAAFSVEQPLFDRSTAVQVSAATIGRDMAAIGRELVNHDLASAVTDAFGRVLVAAATGRSAAAALETVRADRELAGYRRVAGRATDADVLQLDVHLARTLERQVQAASDERIARARLNQLMGEPLAAMFSLDLTLPAKAIDIADPAFLEEEA